MFSLARLFKGQIARSKACKKVDRRARPLIEELEERTVPTLLGQQLFPSDNPWNQSIANAPVAANSAAIMNNIISTYGNGNLHPDFGQDYNDDQPLYGIPYNVVHGNSTPLVNVVIDGYPDESDIEPCPIPANAVIEGDMQNGPTVGLANRGDSHLIVWDEDNNIAYEFYQASRPSENSDGQWHAAQETVWNMNTDTFRTLGYTSADAAGLSILAGLVRPDEGLPVSDGGQGAIDHPIRMTLQNSLILDQFLYPASHEANPGNTDAGDEPPMGTRFRLKASVNLSTLNPESRIIAQAMQTYGLILADNGSNFYITGASYAVGANNQETLTWDDNDIQDPVHGLKSLTFSDFEVVNLTPIVTGLSVNSGPVGTTVTVTGQNFSGAAGHLEVLFGNAPATSITIVDDSHVIAVAPAGTGTVDVQVQSGVSTAPDSENFENDIFGYGISATSAADKFTFTTTTNPPPTVAQPASATPSPVTGTTTNLSVLGADAAGEASLTYTWSVTSAPAGATMPTFSVNGTNAAKNDQATFFQAGSYTFLVTITDAGGLSTTSQVSVLVQQIVALISVTPGSAQLTSGQTQQFSASATDQFGKAMTGSFVWTLDAGGVGSVSGSGLYTAPASGSGSATVRAALAAVSGAASVTVTAPHGPPTVVTVAAGSPNPVIGTTTHLSVLGGDAAGESTLKYTWSVTSKPTSAANPTFSANGTNAAKNTTATFFLAGSYTFRVTITDAAGLSVTSSVTVAVSQTLTSIVVQPGTATVRERGQVHFTAKALDQFGKAMATQPTFTWSLSGKGTLSSTGLYTAPTQRGGPYTITARAGGIEGTATIVVSGGSGT